MGELELGHRLFFMLVKVIQLLSGVGGARNAAGGDSSFDTTYSVSGGSVASDYRVGGSGGSGGGGATGVMAERMVRMDKAKHIAGALGKRRILMSSVTLR